LKSALRLHPKELNIGAKSSDDWFLKLKVFLTEITSLLDEEVEDDDRAEYADDLVRAISKLARFTYCVRGERDRALAAGYDKFPKGQYNSAESDAQARNYASEEVRLRDLLQELERALNLKASLNQSALSLYRTKLSNGG
jgi:hypothetical protein